MPERHDGIAQNRDPNPRSASLRHGGRCARQKNQMSHPFSVTGHQVASNTPMASIEEVRRYYGATLPYYDLSLEDRGDLPFWTSMARRWGAKRILELGCGTGRVTSMLTEHASVIAV